MRAIERCRTAALGGHLERSGDCGYQRVAYNSCRNRNCPKCQGLARAQWLKDRQAELLDVPYFHVVFTVPHEIAVIGFQNQTVIYDILFRAASETLRRRPGASRCRDRLPGSAAHVGPEPDASPAPSLPRAWWRDRAEWRKLDPLQAAVLPAGQGTVAIIPRLVPALSGEGFRRRRAELLLRTPPPSRARRIPASSGACSRHRVGRTHRRSERGGASITTHLMMAMSTLMVLPIVAIFFVAQRAFIQGIVLTGLKG